MQNLGNHLYTNTAMVEGLWEENVMFTCLGDSSDWALSGSTGTVFPVCVCWLEIIFVSMHSAY